MIIFEGRLCTVPKPLARAYQSETTSWLYPTAIAMNSNFVKQGYGLSTLISETGLNTNISVSDRR